jgi:hypothetical protein
MWRYRVEDISGLSREAQEALLSEWGRRGWRLVAVDAGHAYLEQLIIEAVAVETQPVPLSDLAAAVRSAMDQVRR